MPGQPSSFNGRQQPKPTLIRAWHPTAGSNARGTSRSAPRRRSRTRSRIASVNQHLIRPSKSRATMTTDVARAGPVPAAA